MTGVRLNRDSLRMGKLRVCYSLEELLVFQHFLLIKKIYSEIKKKLRGYSIKIRINSIQKIKNNDAVFVFSKFGYLQCFKCQSLELGIFYEPLRTCSQNDRFFRPPVARVGVNKFGAVQNVRTWQEQSKSTRIIL